MQKGFFILSFFSFCCPSWNHFELFGQIVSNCHQTSREASLRYKNTIWSSNHWFLSFFFSQRPFLSFHHRFPSPFELFMQIASNHHKTSFGPSLRRTKYHFPFKNTNFELFSCLIAHFEFCSNHTLLDFKHLYSTLKLLGTIFQGSEQVCHGWIKISMIFDLKFDQLRAKVWLGQR